MPGTHTGDFKGREADQDGLHKIWAVALRGLLCQTCTVPFPAVHLNSNSLEAGDALEGNGKGDVDACRQQTHVAAMQTVMGTTTSYFQEACCSPTHMASLLHVYQQG